MEAASSAAALAKQKNGQMLPYQVQTSQLHVNNNGTNTSNTFFTKLVLLKFCFVGFFLRLNFKLFNKYLFILKNLVIVFN